MHCVSHHHIKKITRRSSCCCIIKGHSEGGVDWQDAGIDDLDLLDGFVATASGVRLNGSHYAHSGNHLSFF